MSKLGIFAAAILSLLVSATTYSTPELPRLGDASSKIISPELEKKLAWAQHFLAQNLPGSQQLRQIMGHAQFGARILYGDCIFITVSPNEQHSALVLRLSRFRRNDPFVAHSDDNVKRICAKV